MQKSNKKERNKKKKSFIFPWFLDLPDRQNDWEEETNEHELIPDAECVQVVVPEQFLDDENKIERPENHELHAQVLDEKLHCTNCVLCLCLIEAHHSDLAQLCIKN